MAAEFTKGPWFATADAACWKIRGQGRDIAYLPFGENVIEYARLISKSPEMLAALEKIRDGAEHCECDHTTEDCCAAQDGRAFCAFCIAERVIREARGLEER